MSEFELERYTRNRMRELRGETGAPCAEDPYVEAYTTHRIQELRLQHELEQLKHELRHTTKSKYGLN